MPIARFPDPTRTGPEGILAVGGDLHPDSLLLAYHQGIFPWPLEGVPLAWFCPEQRGVLDFSDLHVPRSLEAARKKSPYRFTIDRAFEKVIEECAKSPRPGQNGTWITRDMIDSYVEFHRLGYAHSVEAWAASKSGVEELVGGIYGVCVEGVFAGESMFYKQPNASKLALLHLIDHLKKAGVEWIDIQMVTPHMEALGAKLIRRSAFLKRLRETQARHLKPF